VTTFSSMLSKNFSTDTWKNADPISSQNYR